MERNNMVKTLVITLTAIIAVSCGQSGTPALPYGSVSGTVTEANTRTVVPSATVSAVLSGDNSAVANTVTGTDGTFTMKDLIPGNYTLEAKANGYENAVLSVTIKKDDAVTADIIIKAVKTVPVINTSDASEIGQTSIRSGGTLVSAGGTDITEWGVCVGTEPNLTIDNGKVTTAVTGESFTVEITGLTRNTTYYIRAYAINDTGAGYGEEKQFTTLDEPVVVS